MAAEGDVLLNHSLQNVKAIINPRLLEVMQELYK